MKCSEIIEHLEQLSPVHFAESWDNVGLLAGRREKEVERVYIALDATQEVVEEAIRLNAELLLTHHPMWLQPLKQVNDGDFISRRVVRLLQNDVSYYAMHTNFDVMGMADAAADELQLEQRDVLDVTYEDEIGKEGIGRIGRLPREMTLDECAETVRQSFGIPEVIVYGDAGRRVRIAAICPGSGKSVVQCAIEKGADVLITGDIGYHTGIDAGMQGLSLIDAGHYGLEKIFIPYLRDYLKRELPQLTLYTDVRRDPWHSV